MDKDCKNHHPHKPDWPPSFSSSRPWNERSRWKIRWWIRQSQQGRVIPAAGSFWACSGPGPPVIPLPVCGRCRVRQPGATPPDSEPFDGRPRRAPTSCSCSFAFTDASHLPPPADRETSRLVWPLNLSNCLLEKTKAWIIFSKSQNNKNLMMKITFWNSMKMIKQDCATLIPSHQSNLHF